MRIAINGFGRIGRTVLRQCLTLADHDDIEVVLLNDIAPRADCAYLFKYDSVYGPFPGDVQATDEALDVDGVSIPFTRHADLAELDLAGVDVLLECTGIVSTRAEAARGLSAGARNVLISGPCLEAERTIVLGANEETMGDARIVSNASCTTNALAPLLKELDATVGVRHGHMTTLHCYTGSQPTVDKPRGPFERSRAAAVSMVPTTTSAATLIDHVLPGLAGRITGAAVRVPAISVSAVDLVVQLEKAPIEGAEALLSQIAARSAVLGATRDPCVSVDMRARPESLVIALPETQASAPDHLRIFGWYDNEWGFSARMLDMARLMAAR
ncbi:type I glyceraldehyde-3-phosphate dehydrogenase [Roseivivax sp. THAF197b]|uniref:type I glyceraldehyde-3-phosphate dehydrogenase n=1 Tax=Roseivivax sp. THAF197b TaxID=2588299 RepID=UPI00126927DF|nr:glyceraldehyde 3-phosphate dehydrogenase NAD-binding domain-containing protein [Roseivivax sp. THAF197b]QFS81993.1 Glyceraldehyde-3-phosphate dehydrogenase [Roseivivax sp. THAF197b]